jgi:hypothetical protein
MCVYSPYSICFPPIKIVDDDNCRNKVSTQNFSTVFTFETFQITMRPKRKRTTLSDAVKYEIIQMKDRGATVNEIAEKYGVALSTLSNINAQREEIITRFEASEVDPAGTSNSMSHQMIRNLEGLLYHWYVQCRTHRIKITSTNIKKKAQELNDKLNIHPTFKASMDWARNFKIRYSITDKDIFLDFPKVTSAAATKFTAEFEKHLNVCTLENIYNVVYVPIMWKLVPEKTEIFKRAKSTGKREICEDHVIALFCVNASGCHKLPILIIGTEEINRSSYTSESSNVSTIYKSKSSAWMDSTIFNEWFVQHFLESVREKQKKEMRAKTVLLLDNTRLLFDLKNLNEKDEFVTVESIPNDVSPWIQPICAGILLCFIRKYRGELVKTLKSFPMCKTAEDVIYNHKNLGMWDCCRIVDKAWSKVDVVVIRRAWDAIWSSTHMIYQATTEEREEVFKTLKRLNEIPGCNSCDEDDVKKWFQVDKIDTIVMKIYTDEIIREFESNTMGVDIVDDAEAGPSHSPPKKAYIV